MHGTEYIDQSIDIERALRGLTSKQREVVTLAMAGYSQADIAALLCIHRNAVKCRLIRAQKVCKNGLTMAYS